MQTTFPPESQFEFVRFDEDEIAYIELSGGDNEDWMDTLHFQ